MTYIMVNVNSFEFYLLEAYCLGKGFLWSMFFGWRRTIDKGSNGEWAYYRIKRKDYKEILKKVKEIENIAEQKKGKEIKKMYEIEICRKDNCAIREFIYGYNEVDAFRKYSQYDRTEWEVLIMDYID